MCPALQPCSPSWRRLELSTGCRRSPLPPSEKLPGSLTGPAEEREQPIKQLKAQSLRGPLWLPNVKWKKGVEATVPRASGDCQAGAEGPQRDELRWEKGVLDQLLLEPWCGSRLTWIPSPCPPVPSRNSAVVASASVWMGGCESEDLIFLLGQTKTPLLFC